MGKAKAKLLNGLGHELLNATTSIEGCLKDIEKQVKRMRKAVKSYRKTIKNGE
jgi:hypothetical protein